MPDNTPQNILFVRGALRQKMIEHFSMQEIKDICFDLGIDAENLDGTTKAALVRELLSLAERRGLGNDLLAWLRANHSNRLCNYNMHVKDTTSVGSYPVGATPDFGVLDLAGNVWEWTTSLWGKDWQKPDYVYPYTDKTRERDDLMASQEILRVLRGGSWYYGQEVVRAAVRFRYNPDFRLDNYGFRCARSV